MDDDADAASAAPDSTSSGLQLVEGVEVSFVIFAFVFRILPLHSRGRKHNLSFSLIRKHYID